MNEKTGLPLAPPEGGKGAGGKGGPDAPQGRGDLPAFRADKHQIYHNARLKEYPGGAWEVMAATRPIFREPGWEEEKHGNYQPQKKRASEAPEDSEGAEAAQAAQGPAGEAPEAVKAANLDRAARRAAAKVRDLALSNNFRWFITLTLDPAKIDRYDVKEVTRHLNSWLDNQVRRRGAAYVIVPELHKDGALHFHGLVNDCGGFVPSGTWKVPGRAKPKKPRSKAQWAAEGAAGGYHEVYNWDAWPWGFSTAIELWGDYNAAVSYVCKYIRKQTATPSGKIAGRWYFHGGKLLGPEVTYQDFDLRQLEESGAKVYTFEIPEAYCKIGIARGK